MKKKRKNKCDLAVAKTSQQAFQRCFNVVFWMTRRRDVGQGLINVEITLGISTLEFSTSNNVESMLCISTSKQRLFSTSSFSTLVNVETTL